jgi:hypothetical protein
MTVLPQLEHELLAAHGRLTARRRRRLRWPTHTAGGIAIVLASATAVAIVAAAILLVHHRHPTANGPTGPAPTAPGPLLPNNPTRRELKEETYLFHAFATTVRDDSRCALVSGPLQRSPTISQGSPTASLLSILAVLRRPAQPTDKLPVRITYHPYRRDPNGSLPPLKGIYIRYIRRARWRFGAGYYLVPAADANPTRPIPARCYSEQRAALQRELPAIPPQLRAGTLALEPRFLAQLRADTIPREGVCLLALNDTGNGDGCGSGYTVTDIEQGHTISSGGPTGVGVVYGIVPDGVAAVTLYYRGRPLTVHAISNVFILSDPHQRFPNSGFPNKMVWRSATGTVIKTFNTNAP